MQPPREEEGQVRTNELKNDPLLSGPLGQYNKKRKADTISDNEPVKKRRGRPPKQKPTTAVEAVKKRRGRPIKSLIDGDDDEEAEPAKKTVRERAEIAAQPEEETFYDSGDLCNLCQFRLNDPLKRSKAKMKCPQCDSVLHEPCFIKDRSEMGLVGCLNCNP